jgi:hypothetical protein
MRCCSFFGRDAALDLQRGANVAQRVRAEGDNLERPLAPVLGRVSAGLLDQTGALDEWVPAEPQDILVGPQLAAPVQQGLWVMDPNAADGEAPAVDPPFLAHLQASIGTPSRIGAFQGVFVAILDPQSAVAGRQLRVLEHKIARADSS